jgi:hypothetical protein
MGAARRSTSIQPSSVGEPRYIYSFPSIRQKLCGICGKPRYPHTPHDIKANLFDKKGRRCARMNARRVARVEGLAKERGSARVRGIGSAFRKARHLRGREAGGSHAFRQAETSSWCAAMSAWVSTPSSAQAHEHESGHIPGVAQLPFYRTRLSGCLRATAGPA